MHQSVGLAGKRHMRDGRGGFAAEEQQITRANSVDRNRRSASDLLGRIAGKTHASRGKGGLNQAGAIDAPGRYPAPHVGATSKMLERPAFRRLGASAGYALLELSNAASNHPSLPSIGQANHIPIQNDPGAQRNGKRGAADSKGSTLTPSVYLGAPLLASRILHLGQWLLRAAR